MVGLSACSLVDQVRKEKVAVTELVWLGGMGLLMRRGCIRS